MKRILITSLLLLGFCIPGFSQYKFVKLLTPANCSDLQPLSINNSGKILATVNNFRGQPKLILIGVKGFTNVNLPLVTSTSRLYPGGLNSKGALWGGVTRRVGHNLINEAFIKLYVDPLRYFLVPNATSTVITGINDKGVVVGYYLEPIAPGPDVPDWATFEAHGFKSVIQNSGFFPKTEYFDFPGAPETYPTGINNNGDITGWYGWTQAPPFSDHGIQQHGFLLSKGQFYDVKFLEPDWRMIPLKMNIHGVMVGYTYPSEGGVAHGFIMENGVVTVVNYPDIYDDAGNLIDYAEQTFLRDINDSGVIIGWYRPAFSGQKDGFILTKQ